MPKLEPIIVPTHDRRHMGFIREGKISGEKWSRENRQSIPLDFDIAEGSVDLTPLMGGRGEFENAGEISKTEKMGLRGDGGSVGSPPPFHEDKAVAKAKARKKKVEQKPKERGRGKKGRREH